MNWGHLLTSFGGRINRSPFWIGSLVLIVLQLVALGVIGSLTDPEGGLAGLLSLLVLAAVTYASFALIAKRFHDRGKSGWWSLLALVPLIGTIWILVECGFMRGTVGPNQFGPDPVTTAALTRSDDGNSTDWDRHDHGSRSSRDSNRDNSRDSGSSGDSDGGGGGGGD